MRSYTTTSGEAHQHARPDMGRRVEYLPFGELLIEEKYAQTERSNYLFNGKELDTETGWYYYGARYYDPKVALWLSVDPLVEKYAGWSSYSYTFDNPINLVDPDGREPDDIFYINHDGTFEKIETQGNTDTFFYVDQNNKVTNLGTFEKNENGLIQLPSEYSFNEGDVSFSFSIKDGQTDRAYVSPEALASLFGAFSETGYSDFTITQFSFSDGTSPYPSISHLNGRNGDFRYLRTDRSGGAVTVFDAEFDQGRNAQFTESLAKFGYRDLKSYNVPFPYQNAGLLPNTTHLNGHHNHLHLQGFDPNISTVNSPSSLIGPVPIFIPGPLTLD